VIRLTRLNGTEVFLNADLVATVEAHHDTVVTLVDGKTYVVQEPAQTVVDRITTYRAAILAAAEQAVGAHDEPADEPNADDVGQVRHLRPVTERRG
jgi:flagellar protein FlbD